MSMPTIFLSAASDDLKYWRDTLHKAFEKAGCKVFTQGQSLGAPAGGVLLHLRQHLDKSQFVVHLAGLAYGAEPEHPAFAEHPGFRCSYTQFEYYYAHQKGKQVIAFVCAEGFPYLPFTEKAKDNTERERRRQLQVDHRERMTKGCFLGTPIEGLKDRPLSGGTIADVSELVQAVGAALGTIRDLSQDFVRAIQEELGSSPYVSVRSFPLATPLNLLMRWGLHRSQGLVFIKSIGELPMIYNSLVHLEHQVTRLQDGRLPRRAWGRANFGMTIEATMQEHITLWSGRLVFDQTTLDQLSTGQARLGLLIDALPDFSPPVIERLRAWMKSLTDAHPQWQPLVLVVHALPSESAQRVLESLALPFPLPPECLEMEVDFVADDERIAPKRMVVSGPSHILRSGIAALFCVAWRYGGCSEDERQLLAPLNEWLPGSFPPSTLDEVNTPFPAGDTIAELEALPDPSAGAVADILCSWLVRFHPRLAPALLQVMAGSDRPTLRLVALANALPHPSLLDAWFDGVQVEKRPQIMTEAIQNHPLKSVVISAAWCRSVLSSGSSEAETFCDWAIQYLSPAVAQTARSLFANRTSDVILDHLNGHAPKLVFEWLRELGPLLILPLNELSAHTRSRPEYWRLVESLSANSAHLERLALLPSSDRAVLGLCTDDEWVAVENSPAQTTRIRLLRS